MPGNQPITPGPLPGLLQTNFPDDEFLLRLAEELAAKREQDLQPNFTGFNLGSPMVLGFNAIPNI